MGYVGLLLLYPLHWRSLWNVSHFCDTFSHQALLLYIWGWYWACGWTQAFPLYTCNGSTSSAISSMTQQVFQHVCFLSTNLKDPKERDMVLCSSKAEEYGWVTLPEESELYFSFLMALSLCDILTQIWDLCLNSNCSSLRWPDLWEVVTTRLNNACSAALVTKHGSINHQLTSQLACCSATLRYSFCKYLRWTFWCNLLKTQFWIVCRKCSKYSRKCRD